MVHITRNMWVRGGNKTIMISEGGGGKPGQLHSVISGVYTGKEVVSVGDSLSLTPNHMRPDKPSEAMANNIVMARKNACTRDLVLHVHLSPSLTPTPSTPCRRKNINKTRSEL